MAIFDKFSKKLDSLHNRDTTLSQTSEELKRQYNQQADEADRLLREKQASERAERRAKKRIIQ